MLQDVFQAFREQLFIRQLWTAALMYKLSYFEKQALRKKVFLKASQSSQENPCQNLFLLKLQAHGLQLY